MENFVAQQHPPPLIISLKRCRSGKQQAKKLLSFYTSRGGERSDTAGISPEKITLSTEDQQQKEVGKEAELDSSE